MYLDKEDLIILLKHFLDEYLLRRSFHHIPEYESDHRGDIAYNRLLFLLRHKNYSHLYFGNKVSVTGLLNKLEEFFKKHEKIYLQGINYWFTIHDLEAFRKIYQRDFL